MCRKQVIFPTAQAERAVADLSSSGVAKTPASIRFHRHRCVPRLRHRGAGRSRAATRTACLCALEQRRVLPRASSRDVPALVRPPRCRGSERDPGRAAVGDLEGRLDVARRGFGGDEGGCGDAANAVRDPRAGREGACKARCSWASFAMSRTLGPMCEESSDAAAAAEQREEAARRELLTKLAASEAQRAVLRERFYAALRRLERLSEGAGR